MSRIRVGGDLGDAVYSLPVIKAMPGGPHDVFFVERLPTVAPFLERESIIRPLYEAQEYVRSVTLSEEHVDLDLTIFRRQHSWRYTLSVAQKREAEKQGVDMSAFDQTTPWLSATTTPHERVLIHRSPRYNNPYFPWKDVVEHFGKRCLFTGLASEHAKFESDFGVSVERHLPENLYELSVLAAGASLCIGNQSSPFSVFEGLKVTRILEVCLWQPDCVFPPLRNMCVADGRISTGGLVTESRMNPFKDLNRNVVPPRNWQYEGKESPVFDLLVKEVVREKGIPVADAEQQVFLENCRRVPRFFLNPSIQQELFRFRGACENVGYPTPT